MLFQHYVFSCSKWGLRIQGLKMCCRIYSMLLVESVFFRCGNIVYVLCIFLIDVMIFFVYYRERDTFGFCKWGTQVILVMLYLQHQRVESVFLSKGKVNCCNVILALCFLFQQVGIQNIGEEDVLSYLWHQRVESVFFLKG